MAIKGSSKGLAAELREMDRIELGGSTGIGDYSPVASELRLRHEMHTLEGLAPVDVHTVRTVMETFRKRCDRQTGQGPCSRLAGHRNDYCRA